MNLTIFMAILFPLLVLPSFGLLLSLRRNQIKQTGLLRWEAAPIILVLLLVGCLCAVNWSYESKLLLPRPEDPRLDLMNTCLGPLLFVTGVILAVIAGALLFLLRQLAPWLYGTEARWYSWIPALALGLLISFFTFLAVSLVVLGPAGVTMIEQMAVVPDAHPRPY